MFGNALLKAAGFASILSTTVVALGCVPREEGQFAQDTSFEVEDSGWSYSTNVVLQQSTPSFPARSGDKALYVFLKSLSGRC